MRKRFPWDVIVPRYLAGEDVKILEKDFGFTHRALYNNLASQKILPRGHKVGKNSHNWKNGRTKSGKYWYVWLAPDDPCISMSASSVKRRNNRVAEHRLVMARHLGRALTSREEVHHLNGDTKNNELSNLQLRYRYHGSGSILCCRECGSKDIGSLPL
jgi:hypothetical protein